MEGRHRLTLWSGLSVSSSSVPVADRGGEEVNVGFSDFGAGSGNQIRDPRA